MDTKGRYWIQFQKGLGLPEFLELFGTEAQCESHLRKVKWNNGFTCPACGSNHCSYFRRNDRPYFQCSKCHHQTSLTAGTMFHGSHLPLKIWFLGMYLVCEAKTQLSALELHRLIHVNHKTAWLMLQKIMQVMFNAEEDRTLSGRIELDDAYLGGKSSGGKRGRGSENKQPFLAAVKTSPEPEKHPIHLKLTAVTAFTKSEVECWTRKHLSPGSCVISDSLSCFSAVSPHCTHEVHNASKMKQEEMDAHFHWVNTILSNVKTGLTGAFHSFECSKYAFRYLGAIVFRFNHRFDLSEIFHDFVECAAHSPPVTIHTVHETM